MNTPLAPLGQLGQAAQGAQRSQSPGALTRAVSQWKPPRPMQGPPMQAALPPQSQAQVAQLAQVARRPPQPLTQAVSQMPAAGALQQAQGQQVAGVAPPGGRVAQPAPMMQQQPAQQPGLALQAQALAAQPQLTQAVAPAPQPATLSPGVAPGQPMLAPLSAQPTREEWQTLGIGPWGGTIRA